MLLAQRTEHDDFITSLVNFLSLSEAEARECLEVFIREFCQKVEGEDGERRHLLQDVNSLVFRSEQLQEAQGLPTGAATSRFSTLLDFLKSDRSEV